MLHTSPNRGTLWCKSNTSGRQMLTDHQREGVKWFIDRFILSKYGKQFLLRREGFEQIEAPREFKRQARRFPEYGFVFVPVGDQIAIQPQQAEAQWAEGVIYCGTDEQWHYTTGQFLKVDIIHPT